MRKRTFVTALIMFAAIGTGSAGAVGFGGNFFSFFHLFGQTHRPISTPAPPSAPSAPVVTPTPSAPVVTPVSTPAVLSPPAFCIQYGCATTTTVSCGPVIIIFSFTLLPARCVVTVHNTTNSATPAGTVVVTASGAPTQTCTLVPVAPGTSRCTVNFGHFAPANLLRLPHIRFGLFSRVTANYLGGAGLAPSTGTTTIPVTLVIF